jgi:hypothetical protein
MLVGFVGSAAAAFLTRDSQAVNLHSFIASLEVAAWRLKWLAPLMSIFTLCGGTLLCASIKHEPTRFAGKGIAYGGLTSAILTSLMIALFIGITVPERLHQRQLGREAAANAQLYTFDRALLEYRARYGTLPADLKELRALPDPDGSIAAALANVNPDAYKPSADVASVPKKKTRSLRGAALQRISAAINTDVLPDEGVSFTNYELRLFGEDKIIRDGVIIKPSHSPAQKLTDAP